jgi:hypothetical protein
MDDASIDELSSRLIEELHQFESVASVGRVSRPHTSESEPNTKAVAEVVGWGQIVLTLVASGGVIVTLIGAIKDWLLRQPPLTSVKLRIGDRELDMSSADPRSAAEIVQAFLQDR